MTDKQKIVSLLSTILSDKLGGTKYKQFSTVQQLKTSVLNYLNDEIKKQNIKIKGAEGALYNSMIKKINKALTSENVLTALSETLFSLQ